MKLRNLFKRCSLLLLAFVLLLSACTSSGTTDTSTEESQSEGESSETDSSDRKYTLVSVGKPYTVSLAANDHYLDLFGQQLTDGQKMPDTGSFYRDMRMVGFTGSVHIIVDLGDDGKQLTRFVARSLDVSQDGVLLSANARFYGSNDGEEWDPLGRGLFRRTGDQTISSVVYEPKTPVDYRYVRITLNMQSGAGFQFTDEVEIYADVPEKETASTLDAAYASEQIDRNAWKALSTGKAANPVATENVLRGVSYTLKNHTFDDRSVESNKIAKIQPINTPVTKFEELLTDGARTGRLVGEPVWVGVQASTAPSVEFKLDKARNDLFAVRLYMTDAGNDIVLPDYVDVYAADGGEEVLLGRMYASDAGGNFAYTLLLPEYIKAKKLRLQFPEGTGNYWMEEVELYAGLEEEPAEELYPPLELPKVTEELLWDASEPDYGKKQNLLLGRIQQVAASYCMDLPTHGDETPANSPVLTDGVPAKDIYCYSGDWFYHRGGGAIDFFFDLDKLSTVESVTVSYLEQLDWGINHPTHVRVYLSEDATNWYLVEHVDPTYEASRTASRQKFVLDFDRAYAARFVMVRVESAVLFIDEIEAYGTKQVKANTARLADSGIEPIVYYTNEEDRCFASTSNTPIKASDITIIYGDKGNENTLLPMVAYLDEDGKIQDTFMDGFLYCPTGGMPSGATAYQGTKKIDWDTLFNNTFNGVNGMDRLEAVVEQVKQELGKPDYTVQVYVTLLYLKANVTDFGDIDGDGETESCANAEDRLKVLNFYMSKYIDEFNARGYKNLEFAGFYNINEAVAWGEDDTELIREYSDAVHAMGYPYLWIPYYVAHRHYFAGELDFDLVCMQPNYAFDLYRDLYRFPSTVRLMKSIGGCIEIENSYQSLSDPLFARSYMLYLYYGALTGYMQDTIHIYYDDLENFSKMFYAGSELCRMQYDATYHFAKGDLKITPDTREELKLEGKADSLLRGSVASESLTFSYMLASAPEHGYVALGADGSFVYYPDKGYTGSDSFTYTYNEFLGESEPCSVALQIG